MQIKKMTATRAVIFRFGAGNRSRTYDLRITNALLYQLSYSGIFCSTAYYLPT